MNNFDLRKYLAEGRLLKEEIESFLDEDVNWNWNKARDYFDDDEKVVYKVWGEGDNYNYYANYALPLDSNDIKDEKIRESGGFTYISKYTKDTDELVDEENLEFYINENNLLKEDMSLTMDELEKLANLKSDEFKSSPKKLVDMVMGSVKFNLEKDGTNIENASEDEIDELRYKWARLKGLLKVKDTFTSMYGKRGVKTNTDKDLLDKIK